MTPEIMDKTADCYADAAEHAIDVGFDMIQLCTGDGYRTVRRL